MTADIKVRGLKELDAELAKLGKQDGLRILRRAMLVAADPVEKTAKQNLAKHRRSGSLEQSVGKRFSKGRKKFSLATLDVLGGVFTVEIGPLRRNRPATALHNLVYGRRRKGIFHGHLLEWDHRAASGGHLRKKNRTGGGRGKTIGVVRGSHFMRNALQAHSSTLLSAMAREIERGIERLYRRRAKR